jgi:3D (Asp-Asp-Asp) domain-containing protein
MRFVHHRASLAVAGAFALGGAVTLAIASTSEVSRHPAPARRPAAPAPAPPVQPDARMVLAGTRCPSGQTRERLITHRRWLGRVAITEYYSTPERWFRGRRVAAPGLTGRHRVDWLYSARGVAMEGDGIGLDGRHYHIDALGSGGWVNHSGRRTIPGQCAAHWSRGSPDWLEGGWRNRLGHVTFPLEAGGWSNGRGTTAMSYLGVTFANGSSLPLHPYRTLAVDPNLIPRGSHIYIPAYKGLGGGWFVAQDTGGAIIGRHVDVYRPPPATPNDGGRFLQGQTILVVPPAH